MSFRDQYLKPVSIDEDTWFYINKKGTKLEFVRQVKDDSGNLIKADLFQVPIYKVLRAVRGLNENL